jgi:hypothetical protein
VTVYTTMVTAVHHRVLFGATTVFRQRAGEGEGVTAVGTAMPRAVHLPNFPVVKGFMGLAWVVTATPVR